MRRMDGVIITYEMPHAVDVCRMSGVPLQILKLEDKKAIFKDLYGSIKIDNQTIQVKKHPPKGKLEETTMSAWDRVSDLLSNHG